MKYLNWNVFKDGATPNFEEMLVVEHIIESSDYAPDIETTIYVDFSSFKLWEIEDNGNEKSIYFYPLLSHLSDDWMHNILATRSTSE